MCQSVFEKDTEAHVALVVEAGVEQWNRHRCVNRTVTVKCSGPSKKGVKFILFYMQYI